MQVVDSNFRVEVWQSERLFEESREVTTLIASGRNRIVGFIGRVYEGIWRPKRMEEECNPDRRGESNWWLTEQNLVKGVGNDEAACLSEESRHAGTTEFVLLLGGGGMDTAELIW